MIAVTGANGQLGQWVIKSLLTKTPAESIIALVRNPEKAASLKSMGVQVRKADYNEPDSLTQALIDVEKLLLISSSEVGQRVQQHAAVIDAAKAARVSLLVYTSILKADTSPLILAQEHKETEALLKASGLPVAILRNGWYTENYTESLAGVLQTGAVLGAAEEGRLYTASRQDYAEAAAVVLTSPNQVGKIYELAGDKGFTLAEYAQEISKQTSKEIPYKNLAMNAFTELLIQVGLPEGFAGALADSEVHAANGWLAEDSQTLSRLIGRPTTPLSEAITAAL
jgi:NAD(P)H dehydrogenase (quinone)